MRKKFTYILPIIFFAFLLCLPLKAQEIEFDKMMEKEVETINPVYMPVIGIGAGYLGFIGDVKNTINSPLMGNMGYKINVGLYIDPQRHFKLNVFSLLTIGKSGITANQYSYSNPSKNLNFQSGIMTFGLNIHYDFDHFIKKSKFVKPFISVGFENITFNSKTDLTKTDASGNIITYHYWQDGTIRDRAYTDYRPSNIVQRDFDYETDLRTLNRGGLGEYSKNTFGIPIDAGLDFTISNRTNVRIGYSFNYTFSDNIDGISSKSEAPYTGNKNNDIFTYTYVSLHIDLFSDPKMIKYKQVFAMYDDADYATMLSDEDNDMIPDAIDKCLHTPKEGQPVDSVGCPFDDDKDGVPNYKDKQSNTPADVIVDNDGVEIPDDVVWSNLTLDGIERSQVEMYLSLIDKLGAGGSRRLGKLEIPEKFKALDEDGDGYISFDEVLKAIDSFFDFDSDLTTDDIYELNDFFFAQ